MDLSELQRDVASGKKIIVVSAEARDWDLPKIASCIKKSTGIELDLSKTKITKIGEKAFKSCEALKAIILPKVLTGIGDRVFYRCTSLATIDVASENKNYASVDGVLFSKDKKTLVRFPEGKTASYYEIPEGVTSIGKYAFHWCKDLTQVMIPSSVTNIDKHAFHWCTSLAQITIPVSVTSIEREAFHNCSSLWKVTISESVTNIGKRAFYWCKNLTKIDVASGNKNYSSEGGVLFSKDKRTLVCYPEGQTAEYYEIPEDVTMIGDDAFNWCTHLWKVTIPNSVTSIGKQAFWQCKALAKVEIPNSVTSIGDKAFSKCGSLAHITIPSSVTSIGKGAFIDCSSLKKIEFADESGWYFDMGFTRRAVAAELASSLKDGEALYKKTR